MIACDKAQFLLFASRLQLCKEDTEEYIEYLKSIGWLDEAARRLADIINQDGFVSKEGKSKHQVSIFCKSAFCWL